MKFLELLKLLFPKEVTLDDFINANRPETLAEVDFLERQYWELQEHWRFMTKD